MENIVQKNNGKIGKALDLVKYTWVDSTAIFAACTPVLAYFETHLAGMSFETSLDSRLFATATGFAGLGLAYEFFRDRSRKGLNVNSENQKAKDAHAVLYTGAFFGVGALATYLLCGARNFSEVSIGTACATGMGLVSGFPMSYSVELFRGLTDLGELKRVPESVKRQTSRVKKEIGALIVAGSVALTSCIYNKIPYNPGIKERDVQRQFSTSNLTNNLEYSLGNINVNKLLK